MFCTKCGADNGAAASYCAACGASILVIYPTEMVAPAMISARRPSRSIVNWILLVLTGFVVFMMLTMLLLGMRPPPIQLLAVAPWTGAFTAAYVSKRRWLWFFLGTLLGFLAINLAAYGGSLYRATILQ